MLRTTVIAASLAAVAAPALALNPRTFVASSGSDMNPCTLTSPCRSFNAAIAATVPGGEVLVLDSAGYGPTTVNKPVAIVAPPGVHAAIAVTSGNGIDVAAGSGDVVLRGLAITGVPGSSVGINVTSATTLNIDRCSVTGMGSHGLQYQPGETLIVSDSVFRHNAGNGIAQFNGKAAYTRVRSEQNTGAGLSANGQVTEITESQFAYNGGAGIVGAQAVTISSSQVVGNGSDGVSLTPFGPFAVIGSLIEGNASRGVVVAGGQTTLSHSTILRNAFEGVNGSGGGATIVFDGVTIAQNGMFAVIVGGGISAQTRANNSIQGTVSGTLSGSPLI